MKIISFRFFLLIFSLSEMGFASVSAVFSKDCAVFNQPDLNAAKVCRMNQGDPVTATKGKGKFAKVFGENCSGFVPIQCLAKSNRSSRTISSTTRAGSRRPVYLGLVGGFNGLWGKVPYSSTLSKGLGLSFGADVIWSFIPNWRLVARPSYQYLRLGRPVDGSGALSDPNPSNIDQSLHCFGFGLMGGYLVEGRELGTASAGEPQWWVDAGLEFIYPFSAKQTSPVLGDMTITADKLLLFVVGPTLDFQLSPRTLLAGSIELFYNVLSKDRGRLFGARAKVAIDFNL